MDGSWVDVGADATFTANGQAIVELGDQTMVRAEVSVAVPAGVYAYLKQVPGVR